MEKPLIGIDRRAMLAGGLAGLGGLSLASTAFAASNPASCQTPPAPPTKLHVTGSAPLLPELARLLPEDWPLMDQLATEFGPLASQLETQKTYWLAINGWITDRLSGPVMDGKVTLDQLGSQAWAIYASSIWGGIELQRNWGTPPVMKKMGFKMAPPYAAPQQTVIRNYSQRLAALKAGGDACLKLLPALMRDATTAGTIFPMAYNAGVQVVMTEDPPVGQRRPNRAARPSAVRINGRDFMRVDYDLAIPEYLKVWRSKFEHAVTSNPQAYDQAAAGGAGQKDLRDIWKQGVAYGNKTWGGNSSDQWTDGYFYDSLHWSSVLNFGLEAVGLASLVAVINQDPDAAMLAVMGNALYAGATPGWLIGLVHINGSLPTVTPA